MIDELMKAAQEQRNITTLLVRTRIESQSEFRNACAAAHASRLPNKYQRDLLREMSKDTSMLAQTARKALVIPRP